LKSSSLKIFKTKLGKGLSTLATFSLTLLIHPLTKATEVANISIDLKKEVENLRQKNFENKENLDTKIKGTPPEFKKEINNDKKLLRKS
jgi:hypothetical protein